MSKNFKVEEPEWPYEVEVFGTKEYNSTTGEMEDKPFEKFHGVRKFRRFEDAVMYVFQGDDDYDFEDEFEETDEGIIRTMWDERGSTKVVLRRWPGMEEALSVYYSIRHGSEEWRGVTREQKDIILRDMGEEAKKARVTAEYVWRFSEEYKKLMDAKSKKDEEARAEFEKRMSEPVDDDLSF